MSTLKVRFSHVVCSLLAGTQVFAAAKDPLQADFAGYERARNAAIQRVPWAPFSREEWEGLLTGPDKNRVSFMKSRLTDLQNQHARVSYNNYHKALGISKDLVKRGAPDLEKLRAIKDPNQKLQAIDRMCRRMPKGALLHVHPNGVISPENAIQILNDFQEPVAIKDIVLGSDRRLLEIGLPPAKLAEAEQLVPFDMLPIQKWPTEAVQKLTEFMTLPPGTQPFSRFDTVFPFVKLSAKNFLMKFRHYHDHAMRARQEGIQYIEYTTSIKINLKTKSIASQEDVDALVRIATMVEEKTGVTVRFNISFLRTEPEQDLRTKAEITLDFLKRNPFYQKYFVGIDLLGPEHADSALDKGLPVYSVFLAEELRGGLKMRRTQHAGEHGELKNPRDAMIMGAQRLGHGTQLWYRRDRNADAAESILAMEYARRNQILLETNLSSNLRLNAIHSYYEQPWLIHLRLGIPIALSTDNDGILNTSPAGECSVAIRYSNVTYWELKQTAYDSIKYSFADDLLKKKMTEQLEEEFDQFESRQLWRQ